MSVFTIYVNNQYYLRIDRIENFNVFLSLISFSLVSQWTFSQIFCRLEKKNTILFELLFVNLLR